MKDPTKIEWESLDYCYDSRLYYMPIMWRIKVPSGWLVKDQNKNITYVPDAKHLWLKDADAHRPKDS